MIAPGDTQALPRIPVRGTAVAGGLPTVALTLAPVAPAARPEVVAEAVPVVVAEVEVEEVAAQPVVLELAPETEQPEPPAEVESHERIYEEAMATIAALASNWSSAVQRTTGKHRAAAA